jgi:hypothetical protein
MKTACCGQEHTTEFCPHCGKRLGEPGTLLGVLVHCRRQVQSQATSIARQERWLESRGESAGGDEGLERSKRSLAKWQGWVKALEDVLQEAKD